VPDYNRHVSPDRCLGAAVDNAQPGSIIVFHDSAKAKANMLFALPRFLDHFAEKGFAFQKLDLP
jgi:peptidoglycan-N-acetylglucosamine deacetylase